MRGHFRRFIHARRQLTTTTLTKAIDGVDSGNAGRMERQITGLKDTTYQLQVGSILVRNPVVLRPLTDFELAFEQFQSVIQEEYSRGVFDIVTAQRQELAKVGGTSREATLPEFPLDPVYVAAESDEQSLMRRLGRKLYMVVQDERGEWRFPVRRVQDAERPLHSMSQELVEETVGTECEIYHVGRAPVAHHVEKMADRINPPFGSKVQGSLLYGAYFIDVFL